MVLSKLRAYTAAILAGTGVAAGAVGVHLATSHQGASAAAATSPVTQAAARLTTGQAQPALPGSDDVQSGADATSSPTDDSTSSGTTSSAQGSTSSSNQGGFAPVAPVGGGRGGGGAPGGNTGGS